MELQFIKERITIIRRLKGMTMTDVDKRMMDLAGLTRSFNIDRWERLDAKHPFERVELLAKAFDVPVGFFFYKNVSIKMVYPTVIIEIADTNEIAEFEFSLNN